MESTYARATRAQTSGGWLYDDIHGMQSVIRELPDVIHIRRMW